MFKFSKDCGEDLKNTIFMNANTKELIEKDGVFKPDDKKVITVGQVLDFLVGRITLKDEDENNDK